MNFYDDMHEGYEPGLQLDRRDPRGPYSPENCRWVTIKENMRNMTSNHVVDSVYGEMPLSALAEESGIKDSAVRSRASRGFPSEFLTLPLGFPLGGGHWNGGMNYYVPLFDKENGAVWLDDKREKRLYEAIDAVESQIKEYRQKKEQDNGSGQD